MDAEVEVFPSTSTCTYGGEQAVREYGPTQSNLTTLFTLSIGPITKPFDKFAVA